MSMARTRCTDRVVGAILASWRYDISGISPEMRKDYEQHFAECRSLQSASEISPQPGRDFGCFNLHSRFFSFSLPSLSLKHIKPLEHVAFKVFGLDISDTYHMLFSAGIAGLCFLADCAGAGAYGHARAVVPGRLRGLRAPSSSKQRLPAAIKSMRPR